MPTARSIGWTSRCRGIIVPSCRQRTLTNQSKLDTVMEKIPTLEDWVWVEAMLVQSLIGVISANMRQISLHYEKVEWKIQVVLENPSDIDVEDMEYTADQLGDFIEDIKDRISSCAYAKVFTLVYSNQAPLEFENSSDCRLIYRRKESRLPHSHFL